MILGTRGPGRGVSRARRDLRHEGAVREGGEGKGTKERGRVVGKAVGDECAFIPGEGPGSGPTPYRAVTGLRSFSRQAQRGAECWQQVVVEGGR